MKKILFTLLALLTLSAVGQDALAPGIKVQGTDGRTHSLLENVGKSWTVVAWFPKAFTAG